MKKNRTYVIGHKNPDSDSICSAIAYARLCQRQGRNDVIAARAGNVNRQTEYVLRQLALPAPLLLADVYPRVRDVIGEAVVTVAADAPLAHALELFHAHGIRLLPVVDEDRYPLGLLVLKRVSERFLIPAEEREIRKVLTSPQALLTCLRATAEHLVTAEKIAELDLYVGAMAEATFAAKLAGADPRRVVLITGDRPEIQRQGVAMGVRVLIVTGQLPVAPEIVESARRNGVCVLVTAFDSATSAWLTRLSTPVHCLVGGETPTIGIDDRVDDLRVRLLHGREPGLVVLDGDGRVTGVATKTSLLSPSSVKLILVDHNEHSQAVAGADKVEIVEVIDHHRLGNFHTDQPIRFINQPLGSTCTLVATLYQQAGIDPEADMAGLLLAGLLSDTVILKSPTTTLVDRQMAVWLGDLAGLDSSVFGAQIFAAGSSLGAYPTPRDLLLADFKEFGAGDEGFGIGQVEVVSFAEFRQMSEQLRRELELLRKERRLGLTGLLVTDIVQGDSLLLAVGRRELSTLMGYPRVEEGLFELKGVLSRKKQLVPHLLKVFKTAAGLL
ncbi:MAG TPA: putative manganese-dependent inorganic diphosphatase [Desulfuromonas sp.]|nr:putative manganese-dependent inorganic diphosphatase [Desulfuromonas sp.]HBT82396.1 putative manganese-dependent inorganic diphosphatase [Desulfuromonas sp.]